MYILISLLVLAYTHISANLEPALSNIRQVTFADMGFERAGESYFSPDGKILIFQAVPTGQKNYQIYSIRLDDAQAKPSLVSTGKGACTCAFFRPDGQKIIFASSHDDPGILEQDSLQAAGYQRDNHNYAWDFTSYMNIYEANPDGSNLVALTTGPAYSAECAYNWQGNQIVFASNRSGSMQIYTMHQDGSHVKQITNASNVYHGGPFFSPHGTKILYRADFAKKDYLQIYYLDLITGQNIQLTNNNAVNWAPFWHPRGDVVVFTTSLHGHAQYELYLLNIKTGVLVRLTNHAGFDGLASFNAAGTQITWTSKRSENGSCQVFVADFALPPVLCTPKDIALVKQNSKNFSNRMDSTQASLRLRRASRAFSPELDEGSP